MRFEYEDKALWYGTPDAPAPGETVQVGTDITITVGVQPMNAGNYVEVLYRINQGPTEKVAAKWLRNDTYKKSQYLFYTYFILKTLSLYLFHTYFILIFKIIPKS